MPSVTTAPGRINGKAAAGPGVISTMKTIRRGRILWAAGLGLALSFQTGCQTQMAGMTLPSGRYLEHKPQYFPEEPDFPLQKELAYQEETAGLTVPANRGPAANGVNPVPPGAGQMPQPR